MRKCETVLILNSERKAELTSLFFASNSLVEIQRQYFVILTERL